jgi:hypothetical protein
MSGNRDFPVEPSPAMDAKIDILHSTEPCHSYQARHIGTEWWMRIIRTEGESLPKVAKPDEEHLAWAIDQRADVQHTLLALYGFVQYHPPPKLDHDAQYLLDLLIGAAFSL